MGYCDTRAGVIAARVDNCNFFIGNFDSGNLLNSNFFNSSLNLEPFYVESGA